MISAKIINSRCTKCEGVWGNSGTRLGAKELNTWVYDAIRRMTEGDCEVFTKNSCNGCYNIGLYYSHRLFKFLYKVGVRCGIE